MEYFTYDYSDTHMFNTKLSELFGVPNRLPEEKLEHLIKILVVDYNIYELLFFKLLNNLYKLNPSKNLCLVVI